MGLSGIYILESGKPSYTTVDCDSQVAEGFDFAIFDSDYWGIGGKQASPLARAMKNIAYKITSTLYDTSTDATIPIPETVVGMITKALGLWSSVAEAGLTFSFGGLYEPGTGALSDLACRCGLRA